MMMSQSCEIAIRGLDGAVDGVHQLSGAGEENIERM